MGYKEQGILWDLENNFPYTAVDMVAGEVAKLLRGTRQKTSETSGAVRSIITKEDDGLNLEIGFYFTRGDGLSVTLNVTCGQHTKTRVLSLSGTGLAELVKLLENGEPIDTVYNATELILEESRELTRPKVASA